MDMLDEGVGKQGIAGPEVEDPGWVDVILWRSGMGEQRGCRGQGSGCFECGCQGGDVGAAGDDDGTDGVRVLVDGVGGVAGGVRVAGAQVEWFDCWGVVGVQPLELPAQLTRNDSPTTTR